MVKNKKSERKEREYYKRKSPDQGLTSAGVLSIILPGGARISLA